MKRKPQKAPILSPSFIYNETNNAASHATSAAFAERQRERRERMQAKPAENVAQLKRKA